MRKAAFIGMLLLGLSILSFAQPNLAPSCPKISISGPREDVQPNVAARYTTTIDTKGRQFDLKYFWNVTAGTIVSGQGTTSIEVVQTEPESQIVAVEVKGLPGRCPDTASQAFSIDTKPATVKPLQVDGSEPVCPTISVVTPAGITEPGEPGRYVAHVSGGGDLTGLRYEWSVKAAKIVKGQGTAAIDAVYSDYPRVEASVKISGLPTGCPNTASEIYEFAIDPGPIKLGEISGPPYDIDKTLFAKIEKETHEQPNAQLYVVLQFQVGTKEKAMEGLRARLAKQLKRTKIDEARITFVMADNGNQEFIFWLIPLGANNPAI